MIDFESAGAISSIQGTTMSTQVVEPTRGADAGRVVVDVVVENFEDRSRAQRGEIVEEQVRRVALRWHRRRY